MEEVYYDTQDTKPNNKAQEKDLVKRKVVINKAPKLYDKLLNKYETQYDKIPEDSKKILTAPNKPEMLRLNFFGDYFRPMPALEGDEKVKLEPEETIAERVKLNLPKRKKTGTGLNMLIQNKLLTRLPIFLAQIKAGNNSYKLKNEIRQILYLSYQLNKITKKVYNNLIKSL